VAIATNGAKQPLFSVEERLTMLREAVGAEPRVSIQSFDGDFEYEFQMALMNRRLHPSLETVFLVPAVDLTYLSSSLVREVARFGGDVSGLVHPAVAAALAGRFSR
jgi:pantetheine-phosphate adenylyltransferase